MMRQQNLPDPNTLFRDPNYNPQSQRLSDNDIQAAQQQYKQFTPAQPLPAVNNFNELNNPKTFQLQNFENDLKIWKAKGEELEKRLIQLKTPQPAYVQHQPLTTEPINVRNAPPQQQAPQQTPQMPFYQPPQQQQQFQPPQFQPPQQQQQFQPPQQQFQPPQQQFQPPQQQQQFQPPQQQQQFQPPQQQAPFFQPPPNGMQVPNGMQGGFQPYKPR
jgi:hypothetical protein